MGHSNKNGISVISYVYCRVSVKPVKLTFLMLSEILFLVKKHYCNIFSYFREADDGCEIEISPFKYILHNSNTKKITRLYQLCIFDSSNHLL